MAQFKRRTDIVDAVRIQFDTKSLPSFLAGRLAIVGAPSATGKRSIHVLEEGEHVVGDGEGVAVVDSKTFSEQYMPVRGRKAAVNDNATTDTEDAVETTDENEPEPAPEPAASEEEMPQPPF